LREGQGGGIHYPTKRAVTGEKGRVGKKTDLAGAG